MSMHYQSHKHQANSRVQARLGEAEIHRLAKEGRSKGGFSLFGTIRKLFGNQIKGKSAGRPGNVLGARHQRYAD